MQSRKQSEVALAAAGTLESTMFTGSGPAGILTFFAPAGVNLGRVFLNELVTDFFIGMVIWTAVGQALDHMAHQTEGFLQVDPTSFAMTPAAAPWAIGLGLYVRVYGSQPTPNRTSSGIAIWCFGPCGRKLVDFPNCVE